MHKIQIEALSNNLRMCLIYRFILRTLAVHSNNFKMIIVESSPNRLVQDSVRAGLPLEKTCHWLVDTKAVH